MKPDQFIRSKYPNYEMGYKPNDITLNGEQTEELLAEYASQVSATDKKRISELEKEIERLKGLVEEAYSSAYNKGYMDCRDKVTNNEPPFDQFKQDNNL